jgi:hypothetical protein
MHFLGLQQRLGACHPANKELMIGRPHWGNVT